MFYRSGSLAYPVFAHIFNNFFSVSIFYAANEGLFGPDFKVDVNSSPDIPIVFIIFSFVMFILLMSIFRKHFKNIKI